MSFISKVFHLNRTSCPRFPSHPNRTPLKISLSRLFAQEKKTTDAQKQTLKPSAAVGKHQLILEKGDDFLAAGLIPLKVEIIVLASKLRKKVVQRESIWIGTNCLYQNLASFKPLLLFTGGTFLVKLQNSSPPPPHQKKKTRTTRKIAPLHQLQDQGLSGAVNVNAEDSAFQRAPRLVGVCRFKRCFPLAFYWWNPHFVWSTKAIKKTNP